METWKNDSFHIRKQHVLRVKSIFQWINPSQELTAKAPENRPSASPKRKAPSSNHHFSGVNLLLVSGRVWEKEWSDGGLEATGPTWRGLKFLPPSSFFTIFFGSNLHGSLNYINFHVGWMKFMQRYGNFEGISLIIVQCLGWHYNLICELFKVLEDWWPLLVEFATQLVIKIEWNWTHISLKLQKKGTLLKFKMDTLLMTIVWVVPLPRMPVTTRIIYIFSRESL